MSEHGFGAQHPQLLIGFFGTLNVGGLGGCPGSACAGPHGAALPLPTDARPETRLQQILQAVGGFTTERLLDSLSAASCRSDREGVRTSSWLPTACTMGRMMMAPTVWEMKVVAHSTSAQNTAATPHSPRSPTCAARPAQPQTQLCPLDTATGLGL